MLGYTIMKRQYNRDTYISLWFNKEAASIEKDILQSKAPDGVTYWVMWFNDPNNIVREEAPTKTVPRKLRGSIMMVGAIAALVIIVTVSSAIYKDKKCVRKKEKAARHEQSLMATAAGKKKGPPPKVVPPKAPEAETPSKPLVAKETKKKICQTFEERRQEKAKKHWQDLPGVRATPSFRRQP